MGDDARVKMLESQLANLTARLAVIEKDRDDAVIHNSLIYKALTVTGLWGEYVEFGVYTGSTFIQAQNAARKLIEELTGGAWDHSMDAPEANKAHLIKNWEEMRFIGFDSFAGIPRPSGVDTVYPTFTEGVYSCSEEDFRNNLKGAGVDLKNVVTVPGFFEDTLTHEKGRELGMRSICVAHIDSDLYASAKLALDFITPWLIDGSIIIFDEWYQFHGNPTLGEQRAFHEWTNEHPELTLSEFQKEGAFRQSFIVTRERY